MVELVSPSIKLTCTCRSCGAGLAYTQPEVRSKTTNDYTGGSDTHHYIKCPSCSGEVIVPGYMPR